MTISFKDKVAIVTGAGGGLGKAYALELARRGAKVVVNDLGGSRDGTGTSDAAAQVVAEIEAMGGEAIANGASVTEYDQMEKMVADAKQKWGGVHVLINNAGVLRDKTFAKMEPADFEFVVKVHLTGSAFATKACWELMREQGYGRILMTASSTGLFGNFGQANYGAAKLGVVGMMNTLKIEGAKNNIKVNAISPVAATRMTENLMPPQMLDLLKPEYVTPGVMYLVSEDAPTGTVLSAGAGVFAVAKIYETDGICLKGDGITAEEVRDNWDKICDPAGHEAYEQGGGQTGKFMRKLSGG